MEELARSIRNIDADQWQPQLQKVWTYSRLIDPKLHIFAGGPKWRENTIIRQEGRQTMATKKAKKRKMSK